MASIKMSQGFYTKFSCSKLKIIDKKKHFKRLKTLTHLSFTPQKNSIKVPKVVKPTNKKKLF